MATLVCLGSGMMKIITIKHFKSPTISLTTQVYGLEKKNETGR
jgi:hypothetical protein